MRTPTIATLVIALTFPPAFLGGKSVKNTSLLGADEVAIYRAVLRDYASNPSEQLNVSVRTFPLGPSHRGLSDDECLKGIQLENLSIASSSFHNLPPEVLVRKGMRLVDQNQQAKTVHANDPSKTIGEGKSVDKAVRDAFATGLFSMSEIAFDKEHRHAVVSYSFRCGSLCGHGAMLIFEKIGNEWKKTDRHCGSWIS